ncbi:MAG: YiiX/YebB-like N1pC/P60 family cysteine hydrolase [Hyphomicrobiaceae bacterium]|nr:YiiX/YebB-like N1pC/P60 family cysteine hydrolase [Hyphomicrobiaceae bacterium]
MLQRGMANNSAAIARIGDIDSQFSHVAIVAEGIDGRPVMVEALIEDGAVVTPLEKALAHGIGRAILFRHRDRALAREAAALIRDHVLRTRESPSQRVLYDFTMQPEGYGELYCAKLVRLAYSMASTGEIRLPTYATLLDMRNRDFIERIGVSTIATFAPGDLELEPDFDVVAEWHDYRVTSELRLKDMIMTKLFEWMERHDYRFRPNLLIRLVACGGRLMAHLPDSLQEALRDRIGKVPPNMGPRAIAAVAMLHKTAEVLYARLAELEGDMIRKAGRQLHPRQVLDELELMRLELGRRIGYLIQRKA